MAAKTIQFNQAKKLNQRIIHSYNSLKRHSIFYRGMLVLMIIAGIAGCFSFWNGRDEYTAQREGYTQQIKELEQEHEDILSGKIATTAKTFDDILQENMAGLKEYAKDANNYQVEINGTNSALAINKNNIFVSDNANILNDNVKNRIYQINKELAASTNGAQLEVVTVKALPGGIDIESFANTIFNQLGIGDKDENNGILYLIALEDQEFRLEVGYGLEEVIPDATADDIINKDEVVDAFRAEDYSKGVTQVIEEVFPIMNTKTALVDAKINQTKEQKNWLFVERWGFLVINWAIIFLSAVMLLRVIKASHLLRQSYHSYQKKVGTIGPILGETDENAKIMVIKETELYAVMLSGATLIWGISSFKKAVARGKLLKNPYAKKMRMGRILIGNTLYSSQGYVLTTAYLTSNYNSSNWNNNNGGSSGGGSSWGSFGGGSSGGGGASGGW